MTRHLLHIGYPKAGSTFLQRWFEAHPQIAYREGGIAGFRDVFEIAREGAAGATAPAYRVTSTESLALPTLDAGRIAIDFEQRRNTDVYAAQRGVCTMLAQLFPAAMVLVVTRGFRSMVLSTYSQFVRSGGFVDLDDLVALARGPEFERIAPWNYNRLLAAYHEAFGAENVIVMPYEFLRDDASAFTLHVAQRLGVAPLEGNVARINESLSPVELYWYPRVARMMLAFRSRRVYGLYVRASFTNRLRRPIGVLARLRPSKSITESMIPNDVVERFRGYAESLRANPLYAPYTREYLLD
jgi:hypothetical protein